MADMPMDFKDRIGRLFFDRAKNVPDAKQMSEDLVNSMYGTCFQSNAYRVVVLSTAALDAPDLQEVNERILGAGKQLLARLCGDCFDILYHFDYLRVRLLLNYPQEMDGHILFLLQTQIKALPPLHDGRVPVVLGCSACHAHIRDISRMMEESSNIMWTRFASSEPVLVCPPEPLPCLEAMEAVFADAEQRMKSACAVLDLAEFEGELTHFFALPDAMIARPETRTLLRRVEYYMFETNRDLIQTFTDTATAGREMVLSLRTATSLPEYKRRYQAYLVNLMRQIVDNSPAHLSRPIRRAQRYIQECCNRPLRLEEVAHAVGLTPVYLCSRFKQEVGIGFSDYCNQCRIEKAKILLQQTQMSVVEIAAAVGYSGPRYFSRVFKEWEGIRPSQYRAASRVP